MADNVSTIVIVAFVSVGWFFFCCFCLLALWFFLTRKRKHEMEQKSKIIRNDEHLRMKKDIKEGPCGAEAVAISFEKEKHFEEEIKKNEVELKGKHMLGKTAADLEAGSSSSNPTYQYVEYKP